MEQSHAQELVPSMSLRKRPLRPHPESRRTHLRFIPAKNPCTIPLMNGEQKSGSTDQQQAGWVFKPGGASAPQASSVDEHPPQAGVSNTGDSVEWTASEYIAHQKNTGWYVKVALAAVVVAAIVYLITHDPISTGVVLFAGLVFMVVGARKPRLLAFRLDQGGLTIGQKYYPYSQFKSFAVVQEGPLATIVFTPLKRFVPTVDIYIPLDNGDAILEVLSNNLPLETRKPGLVETAAHRIRF